MIGLTYAVAAETAALMVVGQSRRRMRALLKLVLQAGLWR